MSKFNEHSNHTRCEEYLPKPKRKYFGLIAQCSHCGRLYTCDSGWSGYWAWEETSIRSKGKKK